VPLNAEDRHHEVPSEAVLCQNVAEHPIYFHRTLTSYFRTILSAGFTLEGLVEPSPSKGALQKYPEFVDDLRMSHFLVLKLRKQ